MGVENSSSNMQRYFVKEVNNELIFLEQDIFHIKNVMRLKKGAQIEVVVLEKAYLATIKSLEPFKVEIVEPILKETELEKDVTLFFPLTKSDKAELVIQKASELGISRLIFFNCSRSIIKLDQEQFLKKKSRYLTIAKEASEQCHRNKIIEIIGVIPFKDIPKYKLENNLVAYELLAGSSASLNSALNNEKTSLSLLVGPEGGLEEKEVNYLLENGFKAVSLGRRILRCETAAIFMMSIASFYLEK